MQPGRALAAPDRSAAPAWAALLGGAGLAWAAAVGWEPPLGPTGFLAGWTLMMAAMMLPSIGPLVLLHRGSRTLLAGGYAAAWGALGLLPYAAMEASLEPPLALTLAAAGLYELSPLKSACLRRCRDAAGFLMARYRSGPFRLGVEHGLWCAGCCAGLTAVLVLAAGMALAWAVALAALVFVQKVSPLGEASARVAGVALVAAAVVIAV